MGHRQPEQRLQFDNHQRKGNRQTRATTLSSRCMVNASSAVLEIRRELLDCKDHSVPAVPPAEPKFPRTTGMALSRTLGTALAESAQDRPTKWQCSMGSRLAARRHSPDNACHHAANCQRRRAHPHPNVPTLAATNGNNFYTAVLGRWPDTAFKRLCRSTSLCYETLCVGKIYVVEPLRFWHCPQIRHSAPVMVATNT